MTAALNSAGRNSAARIKSDVNRPSIPTIVYERAPGGASLRFWCRLCGRQHWHGGGPGHRVAHCASHAGLRAYPHGYFLAVQS